jgi:hypothetical protein
MPAEKSTGFLLSHGPESARHARDDIWPRMVRVSFALAEEEDALVNGIAATEPEFTLISGSFATGRGELGGQHFKIGNEWVKISQRDGRRRDTFVAQRGARGTTGLAHAADTPVYFGSVIDLTIDVPAFRDDNN